MSIIKLNTHLKLISDSNGYLSSTLMQILAINAFCKHCGDDVLSAVFSDISASAESYTKMREKEAIESRENYACLADGPFHLSNES